MKTAERLREIRRRIGFDDADRAALLRAAEIVEDVDGYSALWDDYYTPKDRQWSPAVGNIYGDNAVWLSRDEGNGDNAALIATYRTAAPEMARLLEECRASAKSIIGHLKSCAPDCLGTDQDTGHHYRDEMIGRLDALLARIGEGG